MTTPNSQSGRKHDQSALAIPLLTSCPASADIEKRDLDQDRPGMSPADSNPQESLHYSPRANPSESQESKVMEWWRTIPLGLMFILIAVASEVVLVCSQNRSNTSR